MSNNHKNRGFASMDEDRQREIASQGGQSQGKENNPGNFANDPERAREAGRKGGQRSHGDRQESNERDQTSDEESDVVSDPM